MTNLMEEVRKPCWSYISRKLKDLYGIPGKTGKQCRERWNNHLSHTVNSTTWTADEEIRLFEFQQQYGNKWSLLAEKLPGRPENAVKNHFYSRIRRNLRRYNKKHRNVKISATVKEIISSSELLNLLLYKYNDSDPAKTAKEYVLHRRRSKRIKETVKISEVKIEAIEEEKEQVEGSLGEMLRNGLVEDNAVNWKYQQFYHYMNMCAVWYFQSTAKNEENYGEGQQIIKPVPKFFTATQEPNI